MGADVVAGERVDG